VDALLTSNLPEYGVTRLRKAIVSGRYGSFQHISEEIAEDRSKAYGFGCTGGGDGTILKPVDSLFVGPVLSRQVGDGGVGDASE